MFGKLLGNRRGAVGFIGALAIPVLLGVGGFVAEYGNALVVHTDNQRVADAAAYAGAVAYTVANSQDDMTAAVNRVAKYNGIASTAVNSVLGNSPTNDGNQAVKVTITTNVPLVFARLINRSASSQSVPVQSYAELKAGAPACVVALSTATGNNVGLTGGTILTAPSCSVASDNAVSVPCGTTLQAKSLAYNSSSAPSQCSSPASILGTNGLALTNINKKVTVDPYAGNTDVAALSGRATTVRTMSSPTGPTLSGGSNYNLGYGKTSDAVTAFAALPGGCVPSQPSDYSGNWTVTCTATTLNITNFSVGGGIKYRFNVNGSASTIYNFTGDIVNGGDLVAFGSGTFNVSGGIVNQGGSPMTFGVGTFNIGQLGAYCGSNDKPSICDTSSGLTTFGIVAGNTTSSTFKLQSGVYVGGGSTIQFGQGTGNIFKSGSSSGTGYSDPYSIRVAGGAIMTIADMSDVSGRFEVAGAISQDGGGSCLEIGAATNHDLGKYLLSAGTVIMGAGNYTVSQYVWLGSSGGGNTNKCPGYTDSIGVLARNVSIYVDGNNVPTNGSCASMSFCVGAGYSNVVIVAPSGNSRLAVVGSSTNTAGVYIFAGAGLGVSGTIYYPLGVVKLDGGASIGEASASNCLTIVGQTVTLNGGTTIASSCNSGTLTATAVLVQ